MAQRNRRRGDSAVIAWIADEALEHEMEESTSIRTRAKQRFGEARMANLEQRTVREIVRESRKHRDTSEPWNLADGDGEDGRFVYESLGAAIGLGIRARGVTVLEADWIVRVGRAVPELSPLQRFNWSITYMRRVQRGESTIDIDIVFALKPWTEEGREKYLALLRNGIVTTVSTHIGDTWGEAAMEAFIEAGQ